MEDKISNDNVDPLTSSSLKLHDTVFRPVGSLASKVDTEPIPAESRTWEQIRMQIRVVQDVWKDDGEIVLFFRMSTCFTNDECPWMRHEQLIAVSKYYGPIRDTFTVAEQLLVTYQVIECFRIQQEQISGWIIVLKYSHSMIGRATVAAGRRIISACRIKFLGRTSSRTEICTLCYSLFVKVEFTGPIRSIWAICTLD